LTTGWKWSCGTTAAIGLGGAAAHDLLLLIFGKFDAETESPEIFELALHSKKFKD
jgi:hypothetical protein